MIITFGYIKVKGKIITQSMILRNNQFKKIIIQELSHLYSGYVYDSIYTCPYFGGQKDKVASFFADKRIYIIKEKEY